MRLRKKCVYICYICIAVNQCCKKKCSCEKKRKKKKTVLILKTNKKKRFQISCSNCTLHWKKQTFYGIKICFNILVLYLMLWSQNSPPKSPPLTSYLCFLAFIFFCLLINQPSNLKIHTEIKPPPPEKKNLLRLCSLQVINTSSHILCLFVMVNKKKTKK